MSAFRTIFLVLAMAILLTGCAGSISSMIKPDEMATLKGTTTSSIIQKYGEPDRKFTDSNGNQVWEYKSPAKGKSGMNTLTAISSFGIYKGKDAPYVDVLRLVFRNGVVKSYSFDESVLNVSLPGGSDRQMDQLAAGIALMSNQQSPTQAQIEKVVYSDKPIQEAKRVVQQSTEASPSTISNSRNISGKVANINKKLVANASSISMKVVENKKNSLILKTNDGFKIKVALKQLKKNVNVELSSTGNFVSSEMLDNFEKIYGASK